MEKKNLGIGAAVALGIIGLGVWAYAKHEDMDITAMVKSKYASAINKYEALKGDKKNVNESK